MEGMSSNNINNNEKIAEQQVTIMTPLFSSPRMKRERTGMHRNALGMRQKRKKKSTEHRMCALD